MHPVIEFFQRLYHFDALIQWGGHAVLVAIVFAETGIMAGFFLPGDSLLVTAGVFAFPGALPGWWLLSRGCGPPVPLECLTFPVLGPLRAPVLSTLHSDVCCHNN